MKRYIGCKLIAAEPMTRGEYNEYRGWKIPENENPDDRGYIIFYPDKYISWSPKEIFENAYMEVNDNKNLPSGVSIGEEMVEDFITKVETSKIGERTTFVHCTLRNGFEICESSACVDPKNYSESIGREICMNKIKDKIWELLGFMLQTAWHGVKNEED